MTVATGSAAELASQGWDDTGLEDVDASDLSIPRLQIVHSEGVFKNNLTNEEFSEGEFIILGLVKQRVMWPDEVDEGTGGKPLCKSPDHKTGFANVDMSLPADKRFPWATSNFPGPEKFPAHGDNMVKLPCASCKFKDWNSDGKNSKPPCSEQWTLPVQYRAAGTEAWSPALLTLQRSGLKPAKSYITSFAASKTPAFTVITRIGLNTQKRGAVTYSTPTFRKVSESDPEQWLDHSASFRQIKEFITAEPRLAEEDDDAGQTTESSNGDPWENTEAPVEAAVTPPAQEKPAPPAAPKAPAAPPATAPAAATASAPKDDDDLPF